VVGGNREKGRVDDAHGYDIGFAPKVPALGALALMVDMRIDFF
jgi:hypothetical protein